MHYSDYTGTAGGTKWYLIGTGQPEGRKGLQPNPDRTLFKGGHTLAELFKNNKPERAQPSKEASGDSHKRRRRPAGCSGFVAPRSVPPPARPTTVDPTTITQSSRRRPDALAKPHGRPRTVFDGDRCVCSRCFMSLASLAAGGSLFSHDLTMMLYDNLMTLIHRPSLTVQPHQ